MGFTMGLNLLLLLAMVATNILSLYHLSSTLQTSKKLPPPLPPVPDNLLNQLHTIRATINQLTRLQPPTKSTTTTTTTPSDLLLHSRLSPIASSCHNHADLLHKYMTYTPYSHCPPDSASIAESLILRGCHPLPRRRCFSKSTTSDPKPLLISDTIAKFMTYTNELDLPIPQLLQIAASSNSVLRLGLDIGGGAGTFAATMKLHNVTVITTTMNLNAPNNEAVASRGLVPLHVPLQQRLPVFDGVVDLVRCGHGVNRWIPLTALEFLLYDVDRVLRSGGYLWLDHFFGKGVDLENVYGPLIGKLGYKKVKWATGTKSEKNGELYLTALLQKPLSK
jgi:SAM-dependent methyltransferase|uniref:Methyltransferase type 11 domain-containing protein n=1 Tax=Fagus sylvatica TaxID=28930 RepID=A0A2N9EJJ4_FAGSY